ncbi:MAG: carbohydrate-binding domain-containing protein [Clostridia bacterium]|nr:carbohydrate-binding domain-containing protein [Clostridia bacterium]
MINKKIICFVIVAVMLLSACTKKDDAGDVPLADIDITDEDRDDDASGDAVTLTCNGKAVESNGKISNENGTVTITDGGEYILSGELNGSVVVEAKDKTVQLILDGITVTSENTAPISIRKAKKVVITIAEGSENCLCDRGSYIYDDKAENEPSAAVFSKSDLTLNGEGSLTVDTEFNDGIVSKDILRIIGGRYNITSADDGIVGRDAVLIENGSFTIKSGGDGIKTTNTDDASLGYISITDGSFNIESGTDGIQAVTAVNIADGEYVIKTGGGSVNASYIEEGGFAEGWGKWHGGPQTSGEEETDDTVSAKAIKAGTSIGVQGGIFTIDSSDDSIHSNKNINISGGDITAASGDDGIHADSDLTVSGGNITVTKSYEGLEACNITLSGGNINITASDDGVNGAGGNDSSAMGDRPGQNAFSSGTAVFTMSGGNLTVSAAGDGIDINGSAAVDGGTVYVYGPENSGNGIIDYDTSFEINGGTFIAMGASGMLQGFTGGSQPSVACTVGNVQAGVVVSMEDSATCEELFSFEALKQCSALIFSSSELEVGREYTVYITADGEKTAIGSYTQSTALMGGGAGGGGGPGGGMGGPGGRPMR